MNGLDNRDDILKNINASLKSRKLYPSGHPAIKNAVSKGCEFLNNSLSEVNSLAVSIINDALVFEDALVPDFETLYPDLVSLMTAKKIDAIVFERGLDEDELATVLDILSDAELDDETDFQALLASRAVTHISLNSIPEEKRGALEIYNSAVGVIKDVMGEIRMGKLPKAEPVNNIIGEITESVFEDQNAILGLTMIKNYDNYLYNHSVNVAVLSISLGRFMGLSTEELHMVGVASLLHDIGKTGVAENIIRKPGGLSSEEWEKVKEHPLLGEQIIKGMEGMEDTIGRLIYEHHVKYDHSGYPSTSGSLHPLSQIITICDAYDALTTLRVYQKPHNPAEAIKIMNNFSGRHFNPDILKSFISLLGVYPVGTMVRLSTNEIGVVTKVSAEAPDSPAVKVIYDKDGGAMAAPFEFDLASEASGGRAIASTVNPSTMDIDLGDFFEKEAS